LGLLSYWRPVALLFAGLAANAASNPNPAPEEIVRRSVEAIKADWAEAPKYSFLERDVESKRSSPRMAKTYRVLMLDGSPYNLVTAVNDAALSSGEQSAEQRKMVREIARRRDESARERSKRIARYDRERERDHQMFAEMVEAFEFHLAGQAQVDGHACWILNAEPKPGFEPQDREGHVLKGMQGKLWIDKATFQWVKVHAEVVKPVSIFGFLARVGPGTEFDLEQEPVANGLWLPKAFAVHVKASAFGFFSENSSEDESYRDYQPMPQAIALLQSTK
jgi:hypothetical protein